MRFTPSANWTAINSGSNRAVTWTVSVKKTSSLSEALSAGTWLDVTTYITELPAITQRIEYEIGQFSSDSISFTARNIDWWEANVFNATDYIELKITATLGRGSTVTTDTFYAFSGFVDMAGVQYDELADTVSFDVFTADELGSRISVTNVNTQYFNTDVDGGGTDGLILPRIPGVYLTDASISSYNLKVGLHTIEYVYSTTQLRLDDGDYVTYTTSGSYTLINALGDEKVTVYVSTGNLLTSSTPLTDYVIVETAGASGITGTMQPYYGLSVGQYLKKLYEEVGITTTTLDTLNLNTFDGSPKVSFFDVPPMDLSVTGGRYGIVYDGTDIWVGVGNKLYKRTTSTEEYTLMETLTAGFVIGKMIYNSRNGHIWIMSSNGGSFGSDEFDRINCYIIGSDTLSNTISTVTSGSFSSAHVMDYNYTGSSYKYALLYIDAPIFKEVTISGTTISLATVDAGAGAFAADSNDVGFIKSGSQYIWQETDGVTGKLHKYSISGAGAWVDDGYLLNNHANLQVVIGGAYNATDDALIYAGTGGTIYTVPVNSATAPSALSGAPTATAASGWVSDGADYVYVSVGDAGVGGAIWRLTASAAQDIITLKFPFNNAIYGGLVYYNDILFGIDYYGRIFQWQPIIKMYSMFDTFSEQSIKSAITEILQAFNLVGTISSHKKAFVYRRGNDSGAIQTTGNNLSLTTANTSQIKKVANEYQKVLRVQVTSGETVYSYDGTTYNAGILSDAKTLEISNDLIPSDIVQDVCKYFFTFYNTAHDKYMFSVDTANMEYEVMDGASVVFSTTKIAQTATGLITSQTINNDGSMNIEVLF